MTVIQASFGAAFKAMTFTFRKIVIRFMPKRRASMVFIITTFWFKSSQYSSHLWFYVWTVKIVFLSYSFALCPRSWWNKTVLTLASEISDICISEGFSFKDSAGDCGTPVVVGSELRSLPMSLPLIDVE